MYILRFLQVKSIRQFFQIGIHRQEKILILFPFLQQLRTSVPLTSHDCTAPQLSGFLYLPLQLLFHHTALCRKGIHPIQNGTFCFRNLHRSLHLFRCMQYTFGLLHFHMFVLFLLF